MSKMCAFKSKVFLNYDFEIIHKEKIAVKAKKHSSSSWLNTFLHFANSQYSDNGYIKKELADSEFGRQALRVVMYEFRLHDLLLWFSLLIMNMLGYKQ